MNLNPAEQWSTGAKGCYLPAELLNILLQSRTFGKNTRVIYFLISGICLLAIFGCQKKQDTTIPINDPKTNSIQNIESRVRKLEELIKQNMIDSSRKDNQIPPGKIKSLTFRIGTEDDRLRIYWEDGTKSDLPCTKEQFIWACG